MKTDAVIAAFRRLHVLVIGDAMLDRTTVGAVNRISPEAPVPILQQQRQYDRPGGAANTALNIAITGARATLLSVVGDDNHGATLQTLVSKIIPSQLNTDFVFDPWRKTTLKHRFRASSAHGGQQLVRLDDEDTHPVDTTIQSQLLEKVQKRLDYVDALVISDYGKGIITESLCAPIITLAQAQNCRVIVDPVAQNAHCYRGVNFVTPNRAELTAMLGYFPDSADELREQINLLCQKHDWGGMLLTRAEEGMSLLQPDTTAESPHYDLPATAQDVFDVTGAGDTVCAIFALGLAAGLSAHNAAEWAQAAASIVVSKTGTSVCLAQELEQCMTGRTGKPRERNDHFR